MRGKLDMLMRRSRALRSSLVEVDIMTIGRICLELIALCLKVTALLDDIPFDPRKRLFRTALRGRLGKQVEGKMYEFEGIPPLPKEASSTVSLAKHLPRIIEY